MHELCSGRKDNRDELAAPSRAICHESAGRAAGELRLSAHCSCKPGAEQVSVRGPRAFSRVRTYEPRAERVGYAHNAKRAVSLVNLGHVANNCGRAPGAGDCQNTLKCNCGWSELPMSVEMGVRPERS